MRPLEEHRWDLSLADLVDLVRTHARQILLASFASAVVVFGASFFVVHDSYTVNATIAITSPTGSRMQTKRLMNDVFAVFDGDDIDEWIKEYAQLPESEHYTIIYEQGVDSKIVELKVTGPASDHALAYYEGLLDVTADKLSASMTRESFATIGDPSGHVEQNRPTRVLFALEAALGGFLVSTLVMALWSKADKRMRAAEVERVLNVPLLGRLPLTQDDTWATEALRTLAANVRFSSLDRDGRILVCAAMHGGLSCSWAVSGLADALVGQEVHALSIDACLRTHKGDGDESVGLSDVLVGTVALENAVAHGDEAHSDKLPSGHHMPDPSDALGSRAFGRVLKDVRHTYELAVVSAPPAGDCVDAAVIASQVEGVILFVRDHAVTPSQARIVVEQIERARARIVGVVVMGESHRHDSSYDRYKSEGSK